MISLANIAVRLGGFTLFDDISVLITEKDKIGFVGSNGAGKSTLMHLFTGLLSPDEGSIHMLGDAFSKSNIQQRNSFGYVPWLFHNTDNLEWFG